MSVDVTETALTFECDGEDLVGILHSPISPNPIGVLIVVGGPQYRVGSHRHFVQLARKLARNGFAVFRFDCRGMGDSSGDTRNFECSQLDIQEAVETFFENIPAMQGYIAWGLCDAASAILMHISSDNRLRGAVLLNPWVRQADTLAQTTLSHHYSKQFTSIDAWRRVFSGQVAIHTSIAAVLRGISA